MDWKILVIVLGGLVVFFFARQCSEGDSPNYDKIQAAQRAERARKAQQADAEKAEKHKADLVKSMGKRPDPRVATLETAEMRAVFTTRGAALTSLTLKDPQYLESPRNWETGLRDEDAAQVPIDLVSTRTDLNPKLEEKGFEFNFPLRFDIFEGLDALLPKMDFDITEQDSGKVVFRYAQPGVPVVIVKKYEVDSEKRPYQLWLTIRLRNNGTAKVRFRAGVAQQGFQHESETGGSMFGKQPNLLQGICRYGDEREVIPWNKEEIRLVPFTGIGAISFVGVETNYFLNAIVPADDTPASCSIYTTAQGVLRAEIRYAEIELQPGQEKVLKLKNYLGPKRYRSLQAIGHHLEESVDFGVLWPICQVLLAILFFFQSAFANWGVAIILLTVVVKIVLTPLTHRSFLSAEKMKALKPEVDKINEKHKDDAQAKQQATMALYKQNKVNPLGGCLPSLLQMPIWIALYTTLRTSPELYRAPFFGWIGDLSSPDPYFITPLVMGVLMFFQQKMTPMTGDNMQAKMMLYFMPIMFTALMLFLPSGLTLYILVNTVLSIGHQYYVHRRSARRAGAVQTAEPPAGRP